MVTLSTIQKESTWGAEATKINQNFTNVSLELTKLGMQSKASFGPYKSSSNLPSGASENATAWVSATLTPPFQVWQVQSGKWVNTGFTYTQDIGTGDLATKEDLAAQDEKLAELSSEIEKAGANMNPYFPFADTATFYTNEANKTGLSREEAKKLILGIWIDKGEKTDQIYLGRWEINTSSGLMTIRLAKDGTEITTVSTYNTISDLTIT